MHPVPPFRASQALRAAALVAGAAIVLTAGAEVLVRRLAPERTRESQLAALDRVRSSWSRPDARLHHVGDGPFRPELPPPGAPGPRLLIVGDSFAMGHGVDRAERFAAAVARSLDGRMHVDVAAVTTWSPVVYRNVVDDALAANDYVAVALFVDQTDPADELVYVEDLVAPDGRAFDVHAMLRHVREVDAARDAEREALARPWRRSALVNLVWPSTGLAARLPADSPTGRALRLALSRPLLLHAFESDPDLPMTRTMEALLRDRLDDVVERVLGGGAKLLLAANPWEHQVAADPRAGTSPRANRLEALLAARYAVVPGVRVLPLTEAFRSRPRPEALYLDGPPGEVHWNARGHALVADVLLEALTDDVPPAGPAAPAASAPQDRPDRAGVEARKAQR